MVGTTTHCDVTLLNMASCELTFHLSSSLHVLHVDCSHSNTDNPTGNDNTMIITLIMIMSMIMMMLFMISVIIMMLML